MKILNKFTTIILTLCLLFSVFTFSSNAASSAVIGLSSSTAKVGDKVTVTVTINPGVAMYAVGYYLEYDSSVLKYESGNGVGGAGVLQVEESPSGETSVSYSYSFSAIGNGTSAVSVTNCGYEILGDGGAASVDFGGASVSVTVKDPVLSSNADLKSLKVNGYSLTPKFSSATTSYSLEVPFEAKKISVTAVPADSSAKVVSVKGSSKLNVGKNTVTIVVQAQNGTQKTYTIAVTRLEGVEVPEEEPLLTNIEGVDHTILTKIPEEVLLKGFTVEVKNVNGHDVETAVDKNGDFRIFYLKAPESEEIVPYLYDEVLDQFDRLKYTVIGENYYIFCDIPKDISLPENLYESNIDIAGFSVECLSDTTPEMSDFHYVYCYNDGVYNFYRFDSKEASLHRFPDFDKIAGSAAQVKDNVFTRFASLSTNAKIIVIAVSILILGIFALLIMLIIYFIRKSMNKDNDLILAQAYDDFEEIEEYANFDEIEAEEVAEDNEENNTDAVN